MRGEKVKGERLGWLSWIAASLPPSPTYGATSSEADRPGT